MLPDSLKTFRAAIRHCGKQETEQIANVADSLSLDNGRKKVCVLIPQHGLQGNGLTETTSDLSVQKQYCHLF